MGFFLTSVAMDLTKIKIFSSFNVILSLFIPYVWGTMIPLMILRNHNFDLSLPISFTFSLETSIKSQSAKAASNSSSDWKTQCVHDLIGCTCLCLCTFNLFFTKPLVRSIVTNLNINLTHSKLATDAIYSIARTCFLFVKKVMQRI